MRLDVLIQILVIMTPLQQLMMEVAGQQMRAVPVAMQKDQHQIALVIAMVLL
jgi:hypothetical protein